MVRNTVEPAARPPGPGPSDSDHRIVTVPPNHCQWFPRRGPRGRDGTVRSESPGLIGLGPRRSRVTEPGRPGQTEPLPPLLLMISNISL
eukprot:485185-Hanusia_phi.AAC.1